MKCKTYKVRLSDNNFYFCPNCHKELKLPMKNIKIKGSLRLRCICGGVIIIKIIEDNQEVSC